MTNRPLSESMPIAPLKLIALGNCTQLGEKVNQHLVQIRKSQIGQSPQKLAYLGYEKNSYLIKCLCHRFQSGEAKAEIYESVRGADVFILSDLMNYTDIYSIHGEKTFASPDDHFQDVKRVVSACGGHPHRINLIVPFLYESRQHNKKEIESLDCAAALQELTNMGVDNIITFDAHDPRVQNAIPLHGFDNFTTSFQFIRALMEAEPTVRLDKEHLLVISPDEEGMSRSVYYAGVLGVNTGMFYKKRDYTKMTQKINPVLSYEYLGHDVAGKDIFIVDDMISSGTSMLETAKELKKRKAKKVFLAAAFGLFTDGLALFDQAYESHIFDRIFTTNLTYCPPELFTRPYYVRVDLSKYIAIILDTLNNDISVNEILDPLERIQDLIKKYSN